MYNNNPWLSLGTDDNRNSFVLKEEQSIIEKFNARVSDQFKIHTSIFPAPFMGDVRNAPVLILMLNPGYDSREDENGYYKNYEDWWLLFEIQSKEMPDWKKWKDKLESFLA